MSEKISQSSNTATPIIALRREDVGDMASVLRGYYRSQINSLEKRKDRKLARQLLQDHLILPKSRQRTSKDAAYIKEILGIDAILLNKLEDSRLIRRIHKSGNNPIYEISHDTLVEPILTERNNREAILRFIKRIWPFLALLLILWFLFGMLFEKTFEVLPEVPRKAKRVEWLMPKQVIRVEKNPEALVLPLPPIVVDQEIYPSDSLFIRLPIAPVDLVRLRNVTNSNDKDTLSIILADPIEVPTGENTLAPAYHPFYNVVVPIASLNNGTQNNIYAKVSGNLKMTDTSMDNLTERGVSEYSQRTALPIEVELGDTILQAVNYTRTVPVNFSLQLSDLFENDMEKANVKNLLGDRVVNLNYTVKVGAVPAAPTPPVVELPSVRGVEVQYSDGSKRFIPNNAENAPSTAQEIIHIVTARETLFSIAKKYNVRDKFGNISTEALMQLNGLKTNKIAIGQSLRIPAN